VLASGREAGTDGRTNNAIAKTTATPTVDTNAIPLSILLLVTDVWRITRSRLCRSVNNDGVIVARLRHRQKLPGPAPWTAMLIKPVPEGYSPASRPGRRAKYRDPAAVCPDLEDLVERYPVRRGFAEEVRVASFRVESPDEDLLVLAPCAIAFSVTLRRRTRCIRSPEMPGALASPHFRPAAGACELRRASTFWRVPASRPRPRLHVLVMVWPRSRQHLGRCSAAYQTRLRERTLSGTVGTARCLQQSRHRTP
jgi:hypothetical protein